MINLFAFSSLIASVFCFVLGIGVYYSDKKQNVNQMFLLTCLSISYWSFTDFMVNQAESIELASFWFKAGFLWPFTVALLLHFVLIFTERTDMFSEAKKLFLIYTPAVVFSFFELTTNLVSGELTKEAWGYTYVLPENSLPFWLSSIWLFSLSISGLIICLRYYLRETGNKRIQAKFVVFALSIPISVSLTSQMLLALTDLSLPDFSVISTTALCVFVGYAIEKHNLFVLNPLTASENIISTMPDSLLLLSSKHKIIAVNNSTVNLLGWNENELFNKPCDLFFTSKLDCKVVLRKLFTEGNLKNYEARFKTKTDEVPVSISASVIKNKQGETQGAVAIVRDITEKKQMEDLLISTEKLTAICQAATMLGHDLRNPLQAITNATYCIKNEINDCVNNEIKAANETEPQIKNSLKMLDIIENSIEYANNIVIDLKDFASERKPDLRKIEVNELVKDSLCHCRPRSKVEIVTELDPNFLINVDKNMIKRVFVNLITNSMQALEPKGGLLKISTKKTEKFIEISFQDTGVGMSKETMTNLFSPFFTTKAQGMGMGLAISKKFVESNGGSIKVQSKEGKGSNFTIKLPCN